MTEYQFPTEPGAYAVLRTVYLDGSLMCVDVRALPKHPGGLGVLLAAPELLAALKLALISLEARGAIPATRNAVRAAIAKAGSGTPAPAPLPVGDMRTALADLLEWESRTGGWDAPAWQRAREVMERVRKIEEGR